MVTFHIIGAGISGLAAAVRLSGAEHRICVYESTSQAGGRCRSFIDPILNREVDNGNHLLIGANEHSWAFIKRIGSREALHCPHPYYDFIDLNTRKTRRIQAPFWLPPTPLVDLICLARTLIASKTKVVADYITNHSALYRESVEPFCTSALNTHPKEASARLFGNTLRLALINKGKLKPYVPVHSWQHALIDPAIAFIQKSGGSFYYQHALKSFDADDKQIRELHFTRTSVTVAPEDRVILAVPFGLTESLIPELSVPQSYSPILNCHFVYEHSQPSGALLGVIGGTVQWIFFKNGVISTTTSAADAELDVDHGVLATMLWFDVCHAMNIKAALPEHRIILEKRATFKATPENQALRPNPTTAYANLFLAGDYLNTGLPACIEGAVASGDRAATLAIATISH